MPNPTFEHRHYKRIAAVLASNADTTSSLLVDFANMFAADNPRFDRDRFLSAADGFPINSRDRTNG